MKITVVGLGYVGLSNALILAQQHCVTAFDIDENRIHQLNQKISPIQDKDISLFLENDNLHFKATSNKIDSYINAEVILIATPPITTPSPINLILQVWSKSFTTSNSPTRLRPSSLNQQCLSALHKECDSDLTQTILFFHLNSYVKAKHFRIIFILLELL
jgi:hypothetical protein